MEYGLFLAKVVTVIIIVFVLFAMLVGLVMAARSRQDSSAKVKVQITHINEHIKNIQRQVKSHILSGKEMKVLAKQEKKERKQDKKKKQDKLVVYVMSFVGDVQASNLKYLSDTVSAIISVAKPNQEVVLKLESGGGYVHSYGLAAAQLLRLKEHKLKVTVCVDKVAASGGYLMAAMADKICAAPFAIIGSIGVVGLVPNINKLLNKKNIDIEYHTSGEYKRTLTVLGKNDAKGRKKFQEDLKQVHKLFKDIIKEHRPVLSLPKVATGEIWYGTDAKERKLIDQITTSDEYLARLSAKSDLYEVSVKQKKKLSDRMFQAGDEAVNSVTNSFLSRILESRLFKL